MYQKRQTGSIGPNITFENVMGNGENRGNLALIWVYYSISIDHKHISRPVWTQITVVTDGQTTDIHDRDKTTLFASAEGD